MTYVRPTFFSEWLHTFREATTGDLRLPFADARHAPIADDQGRVIAAILEDPTPHAGAIHPDPLTVAAFVERNRQAFDDHPSRIKG